MKLQHKQVRHILRILGATAAGACTAWLAQMAGAGSLWQATLAGLVAALTAQLAQAAGGNGDDGTRRFAQTVGA